MRYAFRIFVFVIFLASIINAQDLSREQKLRKIAELNNQIKTLENDVIVPDAKDIKIAQERGVNVFRLMPREKYDAVLTIRGGAAYYSFSRRTSEYGRGSDISLEQNYLSVGFAGADYGFIADLGTVSLADVSKETNETSFLVNYKPPTNEPDIRREQLRARNYEIESVTYKSRLPVYIGHTYILRSIVFDRSDVLVALSVHRKDADGSLIIFWKFIENYETPRIERDKPTINIQQNSETEIEVADYAMTQTIQAALLQKEFNDISVDATVKTITLRGTVPKGKIAEAVQAAQEIGKRRVNNQLTEQ